MEMDERFMWMLLGAIVGFVLGYIVARLRDIEEKVQEVDEHVMGKDMKKPRNEGGFMISSWLSTVLMGLALAMIIVGVYRTNSVAMDVQEGSELQNRAILCNNEYLTAQAQFLRVYLEEPPATAPEQKAAINEFVQLLDAYAVNEGYLIEGSPYTNKSQLQDCITEQNTERLKQREQ